MKINLRGMEPASKGIVWMVANTLGASVMVILVRYIAEFLHPFQIVFLRNLLALLFFVPWILHQGMGSVKTPHMKLYLLRGAVGVTAMLGYFYALGSTMPLGDVTALTFASPLVTVVLAMVVLEERFGWHRFAALGIGFIGVLIVLRPGMVELHPAALVMIATVGLWGWIGILIKLLTRHEPAWRITFYMVLLMAPLSLVPALMVWEPVPLALWPWLFALALVSNLFQYALTQAFAHAELTLLMPFDFLRLVFVALLAYWAFAETPDFWTFIGALVILASALYAAYREALRKKKRGDV